MDAKVAWNRCVFIKAETYHDFAGKGIDTCEISAGNMANLLRSGNNSNLAKALSTNIGNCGTNFQNYPILMDESNNDQITGFTFNQIIPPTPPTALPGCAAQNPTTGSVKIPCIKNGKTFLKDIPPNDWTPHQINTVDGTTPVQILKILQKSSADGKLVKGALKFGYEINNIFQRCNSVAEGDTIKKHVFFVVDTGDTIRNKILKYMPTNDTDNERIFIHSIHCNETLGDSASKTTPDAPDFSYKPNQFKNSNKFFNLSWLYSSNPDATTLIDGNTEPLPITSYSINLQRKLKWEIHEMWTPPTGGHFPTYGDKSSQPFIAKQQKISTMISEMEEYFKNNPDIGSGIGQQAANFYFNNATVSPQVYEQVGSFYQRKRSGDYFQIFFASKLAGYLFQEANPGINKFQLVRPDKNPAISASFPTWGNFDTFYPPPPATNLILTFPIASCFSEVNEPTIKKNIFFLTGDYPALDYALFNKINVIFSPPPGGDGGSTIWVFQFD